MTSTPTLHLHERSEQRATITGKCRLMTIAAFFTLCYVSVCIRLVDITLDDRPFMQLVNEAIDGVSDAKEDAMVGVDMFRGKASPDTERWKPAVPEVVVPRQAIRDRNGVLLASSVATRSLYAKPREIDNHAEILQKISAIIPDLDSTRLLRRLNSKAKFVWLKRHITPEEQEKLLWAGIPGLYLHDDYRRIYPHGRLFSHVLGYTNVDGEGLSGVEKSFEYELRRDDRLKPLKLSMDIRLQQSLLNVVEKAQMQYQAIGATGAIFHIPTGQARAMVSLPDYNPNRPMVSTEDSRFNRLSVGQYELGSIFKTFTTALAFEHGGVRMTQRFDASKPMLISGTKIRDFHAKNRWMSVPEIFAYSSNIGTVKLLQTAGYHKQRDFLTQLGMFKPTELEITELTTPQTRAEWKPIESATIAYGHGINVSPLHLLKGMIAMTGGGEARGLTLLDGVNKPSKRVIHPQTSNQINRLLRAVVQHGTASKADVSGYAVGGKTGTAEKVINGRYHESKQISSMAAAFPMPNPEYLMFVMLDEPQGTKDTFNYATAGWVAAPAIAELVRAITPIIGMPPQYHAPVDDIDQIMLEANAEDKRRKQQRYVRNASF